MKQSPGVSVAEYAIIGGVVLCGSLAGLTLLGNNINQLFMGMLPKPPAASSALASASGGGGGMGGDTAQLVSAGQPGANPDDAAGSGSKGEVCLSGGECVSADAGQSSSPAAVNTTGGNGSQMTESQAQTVEQIAIDYANSPNPDPAILDALKKLALAGHGLSSAQHGFETDAAASNYSLEQSMGAKYVDQLWNQTEAAKNAKFDVDHSSDVLSQWNDFSRLTPEQRQIVNAAYDQIYNSGLQYYTHSNALASNATGATIKQDVVAGQSDASNYDNAFLKDNTSQTTQNSSNTVCNQGASGCTKTGF